MWLSFGTSLRLCPAAGPRPARGGSPTHPDWYYNLKANPKIKAEVSTQTFTVLAEELDDTARAGLGPS
jgi:F420H(2)-dependent quinone reductase